MATEPARPRHWSGYGAFYVGLGIIAAATVLNVAYDRLPGVGAEMMPQFLAHMYDTSGKTGVTVVFVAVGLSIILLGLAMPRGREEQRTSNRARHTELAVPLYSSSEEEGADESNVTTSGTIVLRTQKYVSPKSGLSGVTGWAPPHRG